VIEKKFCASCLKGYEGERCMKSMCNPSLISKDKIPDKVRNQIKAEGIREAVETIIKKGNYVDWLDDRIGTAISVSSLEFYAHKLEVKE